MRILLVLLLSAPAFAQSPPPSVTARVGPEKPRSWQDADGPRPRAEPAGIAIPREVAGLSLLRTVDPTGTGFNAVANYEGPGVVLTLFIFQPIGTEAGPTWTAAKEAFAKRFNVQLSGADRTLADKANLHTQSVPLPDGRTQTDLVSLSETSHRWLVKVRVTTAGDAALAETRALSVLDALTLPQGVTLRPALVAAAPPCEPVKVARQPKREAPKTEDTLVAALFAGVATAAAARAPATAPVAAPARCRLPDLPSPLGPQVILAAYRMLSDPTDYYVATGDSGANLRVAPDPLNAGKRWTVNWNAAERTLILGSLDGPPDDETLRRLVADLPKLAERAPSAGR